MKDPVIIAPYDSSWECEFREIGTAVRRELGPLAQRIDHIGSTAVPGLEAKPVIDIQISVAALEPMDYMTPLESIGYRHRADNGDLTKRYFRESGGMRRTHIHVRACGSWAEQFSLLFRDYLRLHPGDCRMYAEAKQRLSDLYRDERERYVEAKEPVIWVIMRRASRWSQAAGWMPGRPDC